MRRSDRSSASLRRRLIPYVLLAPGALWLVVFFVIPMYFMAEMSLRSGIPNTPEGFAFSWEFANYSDALEGRGGQIARTFYYAGAATVIALLIAYPLAYAIALKVSPRWRLPLLFAVIAPFFTTYLIRTIAWETILYDESPIVDVLQFIAIVPDGGRVLDTSGAVIAGLTYNFLPFMILPIYASLERIDTSLIEAGKDLYASARQAFLRVTLPLTMPGVVAGVLLSFIPASGDYVNAEFLGGANNAMVGNKIQSTYLEEGDYPEAAALSFLMMAAVLIVVLVYLRLAGTEAFLGAEDEAH
jgi:spermidine/putrescine transport system permease protein